MFYENVIFIKPHEVTIFSEKGEKACQSFQLLFMIHLLFPT